MRTRVRKLRDSNITVHECSAGRGPTIAVTANLHGDECNGVAVVYRLLSLLKNLRCGMVVLYPSLNPKGLIKLTRSLPGWRQDINRCFLGEPNGDELQRHAHRIWTDIDSYELSAVLDVHTDSNYACPYVLVDRVLDGSERLQRSSWELADRTGLFAVWEYPLMEYQQFKLDKSLAGAVLNKMKVPSITIEVGPRRSLLPSEVDVAVDAIHRILEHYGMLPPAPPLTFSFPSGIWQRRSGPRVKYEGLVLPMAVPGALLRSGDVIGHIISSEGVCKQEVKATQTCVVLSFPDKGYVSAGQTICTLAIPDGG